MTEQAWMLDTDTVIDLLRRRHPSLEQRFARLPMRSTFISAVTLSELLHGTALMGPGHPRSLALHRFPQDMHVAPWDDAAAHARVRRRLESAGQTIGVMDQMIAAHAIFLGLVLVSNNTRYHGRLAPDLTIENWVEQVS